MDKRKNAEQPIFHSISFLELHHQQRIDNYPVSDGYEAAYQHDPLPPDLTDVGGSAVRLPWLRQKLAAYLPHKRTGQRRNRPRRRRHARDFFEYTIAAGGTITGEHGVGLAKKAHLPNQFADASYPLLQSIKRTLDPHNLLNPGKLFDV